MHFIIENIIIDLVTEVSITIKRGVARLGLSHSIDTTHSHSIHTTFKLFRLYILEKMRVDMSSVIGFYKG